MVCQCNKKQGVPLLVGSTAGSMGVCILWMRKISNGEEKVEPATDGFIR